MEFYIDNSELSLGLARVQGIVDKTGTSILSHVLLHAEDDKLSITATDSNMSLMSIYGARIEQAGSICVKAHRFFQVVKSLEDKTVHVKLKTGNRLDVKSGKAKFRIAECQSADEYPPIGKLEVNSSIEIASGDLKRLIDETVFSIIDNDRAGLNGAHLESHELESKKSVLRMVTTDGNRLSFSESEFKGELDSSIKQFFGKMLLPRKSLLELRKFCELPDEQWTVGFGHKQAEFSKSDLDLQVALVDGQFPEYQPVLDSLNPKSEATVTQKSLGSVFKRVSIFTSKSNNSVTFDFGESGLILSTSNPDFGDFKEEIDADYVGDPIRIAFNIRYFQDILAAVDGDQLRLEFGSDLDPCVVRIPGRDDCKFIVMPMRLN